MTARTLTGLVADLCESDPCESDLVCARRQRVASRPTADARN
jgi:hypothetical protein